MLAVKAAYYLLGSNLAELGTCWSGHSQTAYPESEIFENTQAIGTYKVRMYV